MKVWARLGVYIYVNNDRFEKDPVAALEDAVRRGKFEINGGSYVPEIENNDKEINFYPFR